MFAVYPGGVVWDETTLPVSQILPLSKKMAGGGRGNGEIESFHKELEHILLL